MIKLMLLLLSIIFLLIVIRKKYYEKDFFNNNNFSCEKKGDSGQWQCPGEEDKSINCDYVCDDWDPPDCSNGADEDPDFCKVWKSTESTKEQIATAKQILEEKTKKCDEKGDLGQWQCPGEDMVIPCMYVCDTDGEFHCFNEADEDEEFCAVWKSTESTKEQIATAKQILEEKIKSSPTDTCEKKGDSGQWQCPGQEYKSINCDYVCDDYEPADCDNGADEDEEFCKVWKGEADDDDDNPPSACTKKGDVGEWQCPGEDTVIPCNYVCDDTEFAYCSNGADKDADFCAVWKGEQDVVQIATAKQILEEKTKKCDEKGDLGQWQCPEEDKVIPCKYVCDDYDPADCENGADEDADFCKVWKGEADGGGPGQCDGDLDACGVCGGDGSTCSDMPVTLGCDGDLDACGVCGGDGSTCAGCDGFANSGKMYDACGVCGGDGSTCSYMSCENGGGKYECTKSKQKVDCDDVCDKDTDGPHCKDGSDEEPEPNVTNFSGKTGIQEHGFCKAWRTQTALEEESLDCNSTFDSNGFPCFLKVNIDRLDTNSESNILEAIKVAGRYDTVVVSLLDGDPGSVVRASEPINLTKIQDKYQDKDKYQININEGVLSFNPLSKETKVKKKNNKTCAELFGLINIKNCDNYILIKSLNDDVSFVKIEVEGENTYLKVEELPHPLTYRELKKFYFKIIKTSV